MNFDFSTDQKLLRDYVRRFLTEACPMREVRRILDGVDSYSVPLWRRMGELGYLGTAIPVEYGGAGLGYLELCLIAEEVGRAMAPIPFSSSICFAAALLSFAGSEAQKRRWLPQIASGKVIACVAANEPTGPAPPIRPSTRYRNGCVSGSKRMVQDGDIADVAILLTTDDGDGSLSLVLAELNSPAVTRTVVRTLEPTRSQAHLSFDGAAAEPLGEAGAAWRLFGEGRARAAVLMAFEQLGGADRCLEMARDYALQRWAFGRPIGSFQAVKHKLVDIYLRNTLARGHAYYGAWALATDSADLPLAAAGARTAASEAFNFAAQENIQVHGGVGFTWDYDCHLYLRRARLLALALGSVSEWQESIVTHLEASAA
jgi:acyl-CoA dehydrogenase